MILYRGQYGACNDVQTRLGSYSFTEDRSIAVLYARNPNRRGDVVETSAIFTCEVLATKLAFDNPADTYLDWPELQELLGGQTSRLAYLLLAETLVDLSDWCEICQSLGLSSKPSWKELNENALLFNYIAFPVWRILDEVVLVDRLLADGYTAARYLAPGGKVEWRALSADFIKVINMEVL